MSDTAAIFKEPGALAKAWLALEKGINRVTTDRFNPFYYLGAICIFFLWAILVTGLYLFFFYSITAKGAYQSVEAITHTQWYLGGVMRSVHRYASDGLVIAMILHTVRCYAVDRYKHWRWLAWISGVMCAWVIWAGGIFGYWMVWDERAKLVATLSARLIESLPIFGLPLSLNFVRLENLTDQIFYIILFIHFSSIFILFIFLMVHLSRITKSIINPPKTIVYALAAALLIFSFLKPAVSVAPAELHRLTQAVPFDWFYMFIFPFMNYMSEHILWVFIAALTALLSVVPWLTAERRRPAMQVTTADCTGCELCMEDCPYSAIQMRPRTDGMGYPTEAVVLANRCASCGICMGACDYKALNLPDITEESIKEKIRGYADELKTLPAGAKVMVFSCAKGAWLDGVIPTEGGVSPDWARVVNVQCIGMLQPSMISIPFEKGIDGVYIAGCREGDCHYRTGNDWFTARLNGARPPVVRKSIDRARVRYAALSAVERGAFIDGLVEFHKGLKSGEKR